MRADPRRSTAGPILRLIFAALLPALFFLSACAHGNGHKTAAPAPIPPPKPVAMSPLPEPGLQPSTLAPTGSLWAASSGSLFQDVKAHQIGDIITITVSEESKASKAASMVASKDKTFAGNLGFSGLGVNGGAPKGAVSLGPYDAKFSNGFAGNAQTTKTDSMSAYMTATVVDVAPNGNLLVRGSRWTKVNEEMQQIILEGVVRPADISRNNSVASQNIAEAKIFFVGKGPVTQHQRPGWLGQVMDYVSPF